MTTVNYVKLWSTLRLAASFKQICSVVWASLCRRLNSVLRHVSNKCDTTHTIIWQETVFRIVPSHYKPSYMTWDESSAKFLVLKQGTVLCYMTVISLLVVINDMSRPHSRVTVSHRYKEQMRYAAQRRAHVARLHHNDPYLCNDWMPHSTNSPP